MGERFYRVLKSLVSLPANSVNAVVDDGEGKIPPSVVHALLLLPRLAFLAKQVGVAGTMVLRGETGQEATTVEDGRPQHCC